MEKFTFSRIAGSLQYGRLIPPALRVFFWILEIILGAGTLFLIFGCIIAPNPPAIVCAVSLTVITIVLTKVGIVTDLQNYNLCKKCLADRDLEQYRNAEVRILETTGIYKHARITLLIKLGNEEAERSSEKAERFFYVLSKRKNVEILYSPSCDEIRILK